MKSVYFDTCVYNELIDNNQLQNEILKLKDGKKINVIFSDYIFSELACTLLKNTHENQQRGQRLFALVSKLISGEILKQRNTLIEEEVSAFISGKPKRDIFLNTAQGKVLINAVNHIVSGEKITNFKPICDVMEEKKTEHKIIKDIIKKEYFDGLKVIVGGANFEEFHEAKKIFEDEFIEKLLSENMMITDIDKIEKIKAARSDLPHFNAYLRMNVAYQYALIVEKKPLKGDSYDKKQFECCASLDILVCDWDFLNILKCVYPQKTCVTLNQFRSLF